MDPQRTLKGSFEPDRSGLHVNCRFYRDRLVRAGGAMVLVNAALGLMYVDLRTRLGAVHWGRNARSPSVEWPTRSRYRLLRWSV
jgi:hypothetical protein